MILDAFSLQGKVAVVSGCDTGLGQGMAVGDAWDGTLEFEELVGRPTRTPVARKVLAIQDVILAGTQKPIGDAAAEIITRLLRKAPARNIL